jgi:hypothetical protein
MDFEMERGFFCVGWFRKDSNKATKEEINKNTFIILLLISFSIKRSSRQLKQLARLKYHQPNFMDGSWEAGETMVG